jgi:hypothetical protein
MGDIAKAIGKVFFRNFGAEKGKSESYILEFSFDETRFATRFKFDANGMTNGCISINFEDNEDRTKLSSHIGSNSEEKKCFTPPLIKANLPPKVSQTDILQTLATKIKFGIFEKNDRVSLVDIARLMNPLTGKQYTAPFSLWRVLRGEPSIYEKYGYASWEYDSYKLAAVRATWGEIKKRIVHPRTHLNLETLWEHTYPDKPLTDSMKVKEVMNKLSYEETERSVIDVPIYSEDIEAKMREVHASGEDDPSMFNYTRKTDIVREILESIKPRFGIPKLYVSKSNPEWKKWEARLTLLSFVPVISGGKSSSQRRRTRRMRRGKN